MKPEIADRDLVKYDAQAGVALFFKPSINYMVIDVDDLGLEWANTAEWFAVNQKDAALARYEARVAEAKRFL